MVRHDHNTAIDAMLADFYLHAQNCVRTFGSFQLAVSASIELEPALMRMMYDPNYRQFPWQRTRIWMLDEVQDGSDRRGERLAETLLACSGVPEDQFHVMSAEEGKLGEYEQLMREHLEWRERGQDRLDCCLAASNSQGRLDSLDSSAGGLVRLNGDLVRGVRLLSVLVSTPGREELAQLASWANASRESIVPVGGDAIWYLGEDRV